MIISDSNSQKVLQVLIVVVKPLRHLMFMAMVVLGQGYHLVERIKVSRVPFAVLKMSEKLNDE